MHDSFGTEVFVASQYRVVFGGVPLHSLVGWDIIRQRYALGEYDMRAWIPMLILSQVLILVWKCKI
jgi:hypothetical protein